MLILDLILLLTSLAHGQQLGTYNVDPDSLTVSGISAGGAFASQMHVIYSSYVHGAGSVAGVAYHCSQGSTFTALSCMSNPGLTSSAQKLADDAQAYSDQNLIDDVLNLADDKVFVFQGTLDTTVYPANGPKIEDFYRIFNSDVATSYDVDGVHGYPNTMFGSICSRTDSEYINDCDYYGAFEILDHMYGPLQSASQVVNAHSSMPGSFYQFDTQEFFQDLPVSSPSRYSVADYGYIYVPSNCVSGTTQCKLHIVFHGCLQEYQEIGYSFIDKAGYIEIGEANDIIMLFPQTIPDLEDPNACWDWWGYTNDNQGSDSYVTNTSPQTYAVLSMAAQVAGFDPPPYGESSGGEGSGGGSGGGSDGLGTYNVALSSITTSGSGAGGAMATQLHVIWSSYINGCGTVAGVAYHCANNNAVTALNCMAYPGLTSTAQSLANDAQGYSDAGTIDNVLNLAGDKVFVYQGTLDTTVKPDNGPKIEDFYNIFGSAVATEYTLTAEYGYPNTMFGSACSTGDPNDIIDCDYYGSYKILNYLYDGITSTSQISSAHSVLPGDFYEFPTSDFFSNLPTATPSAYSMADNSYIYVPFDCINGTVECKLHVVFHGCHQEYQEIGYDFMDKTGYLEIAEINNIIMLFPQTIPNLEDPNACWDWWGYTNDLHGSTTYVTHTSPQVYAVLEMIARVADFTPPAFSG